MVIRVIMAVFIVVSVSVDIVVVNTIAVLYTIHPETNNRYPKNRTSR